jgi:hypothetical protein
MKPTTVPIFVLFIALVLCAKTVSSAIRANNEARAALQAQQMEESTLNGQLQKLQKDYERRRTNSQSEQAFLLTWNAEYKQSSSTFGTSVYALAEKQNVSVRDLKQTDFRLKLPPLVGSKETRSLNCEKFTGQFQGPFAGIMRLLGEMERTYGLASFQTITLGRHAMDVEVNFTLLIPKLDDPS